MTPFFSGQEKHFSRKMELQFPETAISKTVKQLKMIDLVCKKHSHVMVEVNLAPSKRVTESEMRDTVFLVTWEDGSQSEYQLVDITRFTLDDYYSCLTWPSHGMDFFDFLEWFRKQYPNVNSETKVAAYFYKKVEQST